MELGNQCLARDLGRCLGKKGASNRYIVAECPECKGLRWMSKSSFRLLGAKLCRKCWNKFNPPNPPVVGRAENHMGWKGGRHKDNRGYIQLKIQPDNCFYPMALKPNNYIAEHRLVMAKSLGRCLHSWELVHHINGIKDDNRIENLQLVSDDEHKQITIMGNRISFLESRVTQLEAEVVLLRGVEDALIS